MSIHKDDRFLWFVVGVGLFVAYHGLADQLHRIRKLTEITRDESPGKKLDQETEDAISLETLEALSKSHNHDLRNAAMRIICERFTNGPAVNQLFQDIAGNNARKRDDALTATLFLLNSNAFSETTVSRCFYSTDFLKSLTTCLVNLLPEHKSPKFIQHCNNSLAPSATARTSPVRPPNRPQAETKALKILWKVLDDAKFNALAAGLVSKWLSKYPFPCAVAEGGGQRDMVLTLFQHWYDDDPLMNNILSTFCTFSEGRHALMRAGYPIWGEGSMNDIDDDHDDLSYTGDLDGDVVMHGGEDTAGLSRSSSGNLTTAQQRRTRRRARLSTDSAEEQAVRRRRREAMVISDGGGPLGQDNIIQREEGQTPPVPATTDVEEQLSRLQEEVDREFEVGAVLDDQQMAERLA